MGGYRKRDGAGKKMRGYRGPLAQTGDVKRVRVGGECPE